MVETTMETTLNVKDICGTRHVTRDDGARVNERIRKVWDRGPVVVDFGNLKIASVSFIDQAIGVLALDHDAAEVRDHVRCVNIDPFDEQLLDDILISRSRQRVRSKAPKPRPSRLLGARGRQGAFTSKSSTMVFAKKAGTMVARDARTGSFTVKSKGGTATKRARGRSSSSARKTAR